VPYNYRVTHTILVDLTFDHSSVVINRPQAQAVWVPGKFDGHTVVEMDGLQVPNGGVRARAVNEKDRHLYRLQYA
jgi:hypothetical protein